MQIDKLTLKDVATTNRQYLETIFALGDGHMGVRDPVPFTGNQQATLPVMLIMAIMRRIQSHMGKVPIKKLLCIQILQPQKIYQKW
ncbi:hypothetical protein ABB45_11825 (plasmid) [Companilactobacillus farciminis]|nr:hypothetical protein ABB45_11825 [Companilactobacillus farciminis]